MPDTRRVRIVVARAVFVIALGVVVASLIVTTTSGGSGAGVILAVIGVLLLLLALPFCGLNRPRPR